MEDLGRPVRARRKPLINLTILTLHVLEFLKKSSCCSAQLEVIKCMSLHFGKRFKTEPVGAKLRNSLSASGAREALHFRGRT
jgi:hypothetical protein